MMVLAIYLFLYGKAYLVINAKLNTLVTVLIQVWLSRF